MRFFDLWITFYNIPRNLTQFFSIKKTYNISIYKIIKYK